MLVQPRTANAVASGALPRVLTAAATAFVCCLLARVLAFDDPTGLILWPGAAVALAYGWRKGPHWTLPAAAGAALATFVALQRLDLALITGLASVAGPWLSISALQRLSHWKPADYRLEAVIRYILVVTLFAAPLDALIAAAGLTLVDFVVPQHAPLAFGVWWMLDVLGMLLVAPALLAWINEGLAEPEPGLADGVVLDAPALLLTAMLIGGSLALTAIGQRTWGHPLLYFYFPIVAWTAVRYSERATALSLLATAVPLLAVRAYTLPQGATDGFRSVEAGIIVVCALLVALIIQAVAADRRFALARVALQARQDMSTGLLNDRGLLSELNDRLESPSRTAYGLVGVHLSNFDALNDLCGPMPALQLEQNVAALLQRQTGVLVGARLSSGRYAILTSAETVAQVRTVAREIYSQLNGQVFRIEPHGSLRLQVSVGGLLVDRSVGINSEDCMMSLSDAMAIASSVRDPQLFVEPLSQTMIDARRSHQGKMEHIREAIREERFDVHAQPIVDPDAPSGMLSYEVLTRLRDRDGELIRPPEFLPLAVQAQMTVALDRGVIRSVFSFLASHPSALARTHKCSINLSGLTMSDGMIASYIAEQRLLYGIPSEKVVFEITESEAIRNPGAASRLVDELKSAGFGIALDDFGTGLATFEYLKRFPLDYLKIDGTFIRNLVSNPIDEEIVLSTIRVARRLNVKTVAEHVHSQEIYDRLRLLGIEYVQGELISAARPLASLFEEDVEVPNVAERNATF